MFNKRFQQSKNLIAYFSRTGENYWNGGIRVLETGNTERVAEIIKESVGGTLLEIRTTTPYPANYYECLEVAKHELQHDVLPSIDTQIDTQVAYLGSFDNLYLGFPIWWGQAPQCILSFLDRLELKGKQVNPFCTHEGSGLGPSVHLLQKRYPEAFFNSGLAIRGAEIDDSSDLVKAWALRFCY